MNIKKRTRSSTNKSSLDRSTKKKRFMSQGATASSNQVMPKMQGILVTCRIGKEKPSVKEVIQLLESFVEREGIKFGEIGSLKQKSQEKEGSADLVRTHFLENNEDSKSVSIEDAFASEIADLSDRKKQNFRYLDVGIDCCMFVQFCSKDIYVSTQQQQQQSTGDGRDQRLFNNEMEEKQPMEFNEFFLKFMKDIDQSCKKQSRFAQRLTPLENTCYANMNTVVEMVKPLIEKVFKGKKDIKYAIIPRIRNSDKLKRMDLIETIAKMVGDDHKVDLKNPEKCILIEVFKNICGISITSDFYELQKFSLEMIHEASMIEKSDIKTAETIKK